MTDRGVVATETVADGAVALVVERHGSVGDEPPLVLVHGYLGSRHDWDAVVAPLAVDRRVWTFDQRGHGDSTKLGDEDDYTIAALVDDLDQLLDAIAPGPIDLLGHSMGGVVAQWWALRRPDRLRSLVLMDTAGRAVGQLPMEVIEHLADLGRKDGMGAVVDLALAAFAPEGDPDEARLAMDQGLGAMDPAALLGFGRAITAHPSVLEGLATLTCPTTVLVGEQDIGLRDAAVELAETIVGSHLVVIPDAAHSPQRENRDAWVAAVRAHLEALSDGAGRRG